jgi:uncharacterized protein (TIGR00369 family)
MEPTMKPPASTTDASPTPTPTTTTVEAPTSADDGASADPEAIAAALLARGRAVLAAQPFSALLGTQLVAFGADRVELQLPVSAQLLQQHGFVHGGVVSYLADNALTYAGGLTLKGAVVTAEMKINYIRPAVGELLIARSQALSAGRTQAVTRCEVFVVKDGVERLCAAAQGTITVAVAADDLPRATSARG